MNHDECELQLDPSQATQRKLSALLHEKGMHKVILALADVLRDDAGEWAHDYEVGSVTDEDIQTLADQLRDFATNVPDLNPEEPAHIPRRKDPRHELRWKWDTILLQLNAALEHFPCEIRLPGDRRLLYAIDSNGQPALYLIDYQTGLRLHYEQWTLDQLTSMSGYARELLAEARKEPIPMDDDVVQSSLKLLRSAIRKPRTRK